MDKNPITEKSVIECDCGSHMLLVQSDVDFFESPQGEKFNQEFYLAMFTYGNQPGKPSFWTRVCNAWDHLTRGTIFKDQICMTPDEAQKLADFINANKYTGEAR